MAVIRHRELVSDRWQRAPAAEAGNRGAQPASSHLLYPLDQWRALRRDLPAGVPVGVVLEAEDDVEEIVADLERLDVVALVFPSFSEGRCYSKARLLRERHGFRGEIRALGDVSTDRLAFMERCGFDVFELRDDCDASAALSAFAELSDVYQPGADRAPSIPVRRGLRAT